jgi:hypothetical protein
VHWHWARELYRLRNKAIHEGTTEGYPWGWTVREHMVIGAFAFPLVVKLLLEGEGHYCLTEEDVARCRAVDRLLSIKGWHEDDEDAFDSRWTEVLKNIREELLHERLTRAMAEALGYRGTDGSTE